MRFADRAVLVAVLPNQRFVALVRRAYAG